MEEGEKHTDKPLEGVRKICTVLADFNFILCIQHGSVGSQLVQQIIYENRTGIQKLGTQNCH